MRACAPISILDNYCYYYFIIIILLFQRKKVKQHFTVDHKIFYDPLLKFITLARPEELASRVLRHTEEHIVYATHTQKTLKDMDISLNRI